MRGQWMKPARLTERVRGSLHGWGARASRLRRGMLDLVFPGKCLSCRDRNVEASLAAADILLCEECIEELDIITGPTCDRCAAPIPAGVEISEKCPRCPQRKLRYDRAVALGSYTGRLRRLLLKMKQATGGPISLSVGKLMWQHCGERLSEDRPEVVVPVPMHWRRRLEHGIDSPALLAETLARRLRVPLAGPLLRRRRRTAPQFSLPPSRRWKNVRHAFSVRAGYDLKGARVLLVDDILTTGATCSEVGRVLRAAGAERVTVAVAARSTLRSGPIMPR